MVTMKMILHLYSGRRQKNTIEKLMKERTMAAMATAGDDDEEIASIDTNAKSVQKSDDKDNNTEGSHSQTDSQAAGETSNEASDNK